MSRRQRDRGPERGAKDVTLLKAEMIEKREQVGHQIVMPIYPNASPITTSLGKFVGDATKLPGEQGDDRNK
jgi:hypothetical protein